MKKIHMKGNKHNMNKKILIPVVVAVVAVGGFVAMSGNKEEKNINTTIQRTVSVDELFALKADSEDRGTIRKYTTADVMSGGGFTITYVNEGGKLKNITLNDLYIMGDVEKFEGATIVVRKLNNNVLTNDQINILSYSLNQEEVAAKSMIERLTRGKSIEIGFIMEKEEKVEDTK